MKNLGTRIEQNPIVHAIGRFTGCVDGKTNRIRPETGCAKMRDNLNAGMTVTDAIYQRWFAAKQKGGKMKYQITVIVDAEKTSEAAVKAESIGEVILVQARPTQQGIPVIGGQTK